MAKKLSGLTWFAAGFLIAAVVAWFGVKHMQHTILRAFLTDAGTYRNSLSVEPYNDYASTENATLLASQEQTDDDGCGCPACCAIEKL